MHICRVRFKLEIIFTICCVVFAAPEVELKCAGIESPFDILPEGDHVIEYGTTLELFCQLNESYPGVEKYNSKDLQFYTLDKRNKIPLSNVTIINGTTIKIDLVNPPLGSTYYYCALNDTNDCLTNVQVGYKPQPVLNFECTSFNWERLYCQWTPPDNPIHTEYRLNYSLAGRAGRIPRPCPNDLDIKNNSCIYDFETIPNYRQPYEYFLFEIFGKNVLGNHSKTYRFHHYAHVIPNKPENVTVISKAVGSALIAWNIPYPLFHFPPGLSLKIEYKNKWENWVEVNIPYTEKISGKNYTYNITGLKYSHTPYDVRIYLKSFVAKAGPNDWSQPASITFLTPSTVPSRAPLTTQGCFDIVSNGNDTDVFIYWARIPEKYENGANFTYNVICTKNNEKDCGRPLEKSMIYAKFPVSNQYSYRFTIYSVNEAGRSEDNSFVYVSKYESLIQPESFTKVAYDQGVFELSWKPVLHKDLSNYTIFWCKEDKDLPVPCKGDLDWVTVDRSTTSRNITMNDVTKFYKFAISANLADGSSSGMVWSSCVIFHDKVLKKVDDFHISRVGSREVDVVWEIRCAQSSAFKGFAFYYCPVGFSPQDNNCIGNATEEITKLNGSQQRNVTLTNLRPYTTYKLQISIISLDGSHQIQLGPRSVAKRFLTLEDAPSPPPNLRVTSITNSSVTLKWDLPDEMNGILQTYKLYMMYPGGEKKIKFNAQNVSDNSFIRNYEVGDLIGHTVYNFTLRVCTSLIKCSDHSNPVMVTTRVGVPGKLMKPQVSLLSPTMVDVSWTQPVPAAGSLEYYQLSVGVDQNSEQEVFNVTGLRAKLEFQSCKTKYKSEFRIRAINIDGDLRYFGPWSDVTKIKCGSSVWVENNALINWISGTTTMIILTACAFCIVKKGWLQCRKMKDVEVKLPPGLQSQELEKDSHDYVHLERWPPRSPDNVNGSVGTVLAPDEESLLDKKSDESMDITSFKMPVKNGGDSSGCSVGRESVSSSITSDTHISSDSGAEPDQSAMTPTVFEPWNANLDNSRNLTASEILNLSDLGEWDFSDMTTPRYTKVGFTNSFVPEKNLPSKGYVTIASVKSINPSQSSNIRQNTNANVSSGSSGIGDSFSSGLTGNEVSVSGPKYVSLAHFKGQSLGELTGSSQSGARPAAMAQISPTLSQLHETLKLEDDKTEDSIEDDFSGNETETETIHEVPITRNLTVMPPYVSMADSSSATVGIVIHDDDDDDNEDDDHDDEGHGDEKKDDIDIDKTETKGNEESKAVSDERKAESNETSKSNESERLPLELSETDKAKTVSAKNKTVGENSNSNENTDKKSVTFSSYILHHLFGKEPVHTYLSTAD